ncbi:hypothetical protein RhiirC2_791464 [Rhizophagus irregularis]|uniref:Uncharacterized protein n=1 Tax=Rhizophagus irregularis TaxID=588596 RepID=A0A2N1MJ61_9GLOM|nr:hypothetical protein RhiirC2_791464 [Rhizophagus irregularis]
MNAAATVPMIQPITQNNGIQMNQMNEFKFFHYAPNDDKFYHITCQIILQGSVFLDDRNYDHGFFYNINPTGNYYVTCKILPYSLIVNIMNKNIYGIDIGINDLERKELLSLNQKLNLEQDLKQILHFHLVQNHILDSEIADRNLNSSYGHNTQTISITDSQDNFDNNFSQQTGVEYYNNNVTNPRQQVDFNNIPQHIPKELGYNGNINSFNGNIGNNVMITQTITDSQNNDFPFSTSVTPQNRISYHVTNSQQIIDFDNIPRQITDRDTNLFHGNIINNTLSTQPVSTIDIGQNYGNGHQNVNRTRVFAYTQQQVDYRDTDSHNGNIGNNVTTIQSNGLTCDHQDLNDIHQATQPHVNLNDNYRDTDSHNGNIVNNVMTICGHQDINDFRLQQQVDSNHIQHQQ